MAGEQSYFNLRELKIVGQSVIWVFDSDKGGYYIND